MNRATAGAGRNTRNVAAPPDLSVSKAKRTRYSQGDYRDELIIDEAHQVAEMAKAKSEVASTITAKHNALANGLLKAQEIIQNSSNSSIGDELERELKSLMHKAKLDGFLEAAKKAEFKGNKKKAIDQYQEALFFIRNDDVPDDKQSQEIEQIETKLKDLGAENRENDAPKTSGDLIAEATDGANLVDGKQTWEIAKEKKDEIEIMKQCCEAELKTMDKTGLVPAPYYFERVAVLSRKEKNYKQEVFYCEQYIEKVEAFYAKIGTEGVADVRKGPRYKAILKRLPKAKELHAKHGT